MIKAPMPTEEQEQRTLVEWLEWHGICFFHPANEGQHKPQYRAKQAALGLKAGVPDLLIFDPPPIGGYVGVAIELKRRRGGQVSTAQREWLSQLEKRGWRAEVCKGADKAIELLENLGYGRRRGVG